ncbi:MAG: ABC transporter permease [Rhodothermales bacterium]|nr:ABC transporter permease [Rhodothermales bacterium]MBO6780240.1 ABC transporter permease [Rhodothermales bacterium]
MKALLRILDALLGPAHSTLIGDLAACYHEERRARGLLLASLWLTGQLLLAVPRVLWLNLIWEREMLKNYVTVALRQMRRAWSFSLINVLGLAMSLAVCLVILSLLHDQRGFDTFHPDGDQVYRVTSRVTESFGTFSMATSSGPLGPELVAASDDVEALVQLRRTWGHLQREDGFRVDFAGLYAPPGFFDLFGFPLEGSIPSQALDDPFEVVISRDVAESLFPGQDPIGRTLEWEGMFPVVVGGVMAPPPGKTHLRADVLVSFETLHARAARGSEMALEDWNRNTAYYNYLRLKPGADPAAIAAMANTLSLSHYTGDGESPTFAMQSLGSINLGRDLSNQIAEVMPRGFAIILSALALVLVLTAVFNYVNLTIARSLRRTRELGIRKVVGARRGQLMQQLVAEAVLTALLALAIAGAALTWLLPQFNNLSAVSADAVMRVESISSGLVLQFVLLAVVLGVLAGLVPAWRMSRVAPALSVKGRLSAPRRGRFGVRKALVVVQFVVSMVAISVTVLLHRQIDFISGSELGFDEATLVNVDLQGLDPDLVRAELLAVPGVEQVSLMSAPPSSGTRTTTDIQTDRMTDPMLLPRYSVDAHFLDQYRVQLLAGRELREGAQAELLLNEAGVAALDLGPPEQAVGTILTFDEALVQAPATLVGVVTNFYADGVERGYQPVALVSRPALYTTASVRMAAGSVRGAMERLGGAWERLAPGTTLEAAFFDAQIQESYRDMRATGRILGTFVVLIVMIAGLGLLGMVGYAAEVRVREVGIRKVVGATMGQLVGLLSREYLMLVGIALVLAMPVAWIITNRLLEQYAQHVVHTPWGLLLSVSPVIVAALVIVVSQTLRAALTNPVEVLRSE